ncbi:hypothetical protein CSA56_12385 [candidate division KSB3 bacterium]|uniref:Uncharacterized protein n=1 Tax=candidate division KSB3 bacterium TaxID=2044937 RepID=A0A2G6KC59_9BACT|nr:MAG: hypothetical protein CSA56_12385 [candidate division KSB3 bacterium]
MPHAIIDGPASIEKYYETFEAIDMREGGSIMKVKDAFLNGSKTKLLLECIVVDDRIPQSFYIAISHKNGKLSVHLDALTDPEKNDGIRRLLALVAHQLKSQDPTCRYTTHNLDGFLPNDEN